MHTVSRRLVTFFLALVLSPLSLGLVAFSAYDPLQLFHPPWRGEAKLHSNMRLQAAGLVRHAQFDSVILGTSMMENMSAKEAGQLLGGRFANLSLTAGDFYERSILLDDMLRRRPVRQVIYSLDYIYITRRKGYGLFPLPTFDFLYDRNPFNDFRVYLNRHFADCLAHWSDEETCAGRPVGLDRPNAWFGEAEHAVRFGGWEKWCAARDNYQIRDSYRSITTVADAIASGKVNPVSEEEKRAELDRTLQYVDEHLIRPIRANPNTRFILVFPPYSRITFAIWHQGMPLYAYLHTEVIRHLAGMAKRLPNLEVYGFEDANFLDAIAHYKDLHHYSPSIDSWILGEIAAGRHRLNSDDVEGYLQVARESAMVLNLRDIENRLAACGVGR